MLQFTEENIQWLDLLIEEAKKKTENETKITKLSDLQDKLQLLGENTLNTSITEQQINDVNDTLKELQDITDAYSNQVDISVLEEYDHLKKRMSTKLEFLATFKDIFIEEANYLEDTLKKEIRGRIANDIKNNDPECKSFSQADSMVEFDTRYTSLKSHVYYVKKVANNLKTKYDFYMKFWQMIFQSVSTASKERYASRYSNET